MEKATNKLYKASIDPARTVFIELLKINYFCATMPHNWLKNLVPLFHPITSKTKTKRDLLAQVFPRFASAICDNFQF